MSKTIKIPGRIESVATGKVVTGANAILDDTKGKKQNVINEETDAELLRLDQEKQGNLTFDQTPTENSTNPVTSGGVYAADHLLSQAIEAILLLIPSAASELNKLVDLATMNSSISTATASFKGTYNLVSDLYLTVSATHAQIAAALDALSLDADNNDYAFVQVPNTDTAPMDIAKTERYKFNGENWAYEYDLNNSGFTTAQWNAINSGITALLVAKLSALPTNEALTLALAGKQDNLTFDNAPTAGSNNPVKSGGIYTRNNEIVALINALDAAKQNVLTFDTTPTNGSTNPVTSNGVYLAIQLVQTAVVALDGRMGTAETKISTAEGNIVNLQAAYTALTQSDIVVVSGALPSSGQQQNIIYRQPDQDHTPPQFYSDYMWNGTAWVLMATYNNAIDLRPKKGSQNLVTSGGVFDNMGALDVSELNATENPHTLKPYATLDAALADIPSDYQKGGMSIKYVQTSDNKYVQYRLRSNQWSSAVDDWQNVDSLQTGFVVGTEKMPVKTVLYDERIRVNKTMTPLPIPLTSDGDYNIKLKSASSLSSIVFYLYNNGTQVKSWGINVGSSINVSGYNADSVAYYSGTNLNIGDTIELEITRNDSIINDVADIKYIDNIKFNNIFEYKAGSATDNRHPIDVKGLHRVVIQTQALNGAAGEVVFYLEDANHNDLVSIGCTLGESITVDNLPSDASYISWYIAAGWIVSTGNFKVSVKEESSRDYADINILYKDADCIFKKALKVDSTTSVSWQSSKTSLQINKGDKVKVIFSNENSNQVANNIRIYFMDSQSQDVYYKDCPINTVFEWTATENIAYIAYYFAAGTYSKEDMLHFTVFKTASYVEEESISDNLIYGPINKTVKGTSGYLYEQIVYADVVEGEVYLVNYDKITGTLYTSNPLVVIFYNSNNTQIQRQSVNYPLIVKVPAGAAKMEVLLYVNDSGTSHDVEVLYHNVYVAKSYCGQVYLNGKLSAATYPKDYYFVDNYLGNKVARINELVNANYGKGDAFIFLTDTHYTRYNAKQSPSLVNYISEMTGVTKIIGGGDYEDQGANQGNNLMFRQLTDNFTKKDINVVIGNHEYLAMVTNSEIAMLYQQLSQYMPLYKGDINRWYYYYDDNFRKIRWIFMNAWDESEATKQQDPTKSGSATNGYTQEQLDWLQNEALSNVPSGYDIINVSHGRIDLLQTLEHNNELNVTGEKPVFDILDDYKEEHAGVHILCLRGHVHRDRLIYTDGGIPVVLTTCDKNVSWPSAAEREDPSSPYYQWYPDLDVDRTTGTIYEQAFDVCILNTDTHTLTAVRIGGKARNGVGNDPGSEVEERTVTY